MRARSALFAAPLAAAALAGCGVGGGDKGDAETVRDVRSVVNRFAASTGPDACDLLTADALSDVYGGGGEPNREKTERDRATCRARAGQFKGAKVDIDSVQVIGDRASRVKAFSPDRRTEYTVTLRRPDKTWLIDQISRKSVAAGDVP